LWGPDAETGSEKFHMRTGGVDRGGNPRKEFYSDKPRSLTKRPLVDRGIRRGSLQAKKGGGSVKKGRQPHGKSGRQKGKKHGGGEKGGER